MFRAAVPGRKHNARLMPGVESIETPPGLHGLCWPVQPPGVAVVSGMRWRAFGRCDTLQRVADGIIAACVGLVSAAAERYKLQEKRL